tara:strand:+ start:356 stop:1132 length:777 start_codon:yes stop_codon:yes gene_type:complete
VVNFLNFDDVKKSPNLEDIPKRTGDIRRIFITEKLKQIGVELSDLKLGDFDQIGELTAKKQRSPGSDLYNKVGAFFRPNYERGILIYSLIKKYKIKSYLEIGFGRGYSCMCAALAMSELGEGKITTIDPNLDNDFLQGLSQSFPEDWFSMIHFIKGTSQEFLRGTDEKYDFIYVDGDHSYQAVKDDWELSKDKYNKIILFDDYHLPGKIEKDIDCSNVIDQIEDDSKELIIMDRRIFFDDRRIPDEEIDYGQVLITKE